MAININTIGVSGTILLWLGVITCLGGLALFLAVCGGIAPAGEGDDLHLHDTYFIMINGMRKMIFLLPLAAGIILMASGFLIRGQLPFMNSILISITDQKHEAGKTLHPTAISVVFEIKFPPAADGSDEA